MQPLLLALLVAVHLAALLAPGLFFAALLRQRQPVPPACEVLLALGLSALLGYMVFWVWFFSPAAGRWASLALLALAGSVLLFGMTAALVSPQRRSDLCSAWFTADVLVPVVLMFLMACAYLGLVHAVQGNYVPEAHVNGRFPAYLTPDNLIPLYFADGIASGSVPRPLLGDWLSSDRPPLQTGVVLAQFLLRDWLARPGLSYQVLGTLLQASWLPAVWALCRQAGLDSRRTAVVLALLIVNGFFYLNTVFVWPKLLAASLTILALLLLLPLDGRRPTVTETALAAGAAALGLLAHGSVFFTLLPLAGLLIVPRRFPGWKQSVAGLATILGLLAPWSAYQRFHDPPGNRLVKWHLAGVVPLDERSSWQAIRDTYAQETLGHFLLGRGENLCALIWPEGWVRPTGSPWQQFEFHGLLLAGGVLNVGWLILAIPRLRGRLLPATALQRVGLYLGVGLAGLLIWVLLLVLPGSTVLHQGSYATVLLLFVGLAMILSSLSGRLVLGLLLSQGMLFSLCWVFFPLQAGESLSAAMAGGCVQAFLAVAGVLCRLGRAAAPAGTEEPLQKVGHPSADRLPLCLDPQESPDPNARRADRAHRVSG
jgi:hypothetical protein